MLTELQKNILRRAGYSESRLEDLSLNQNDCNPPELKEFYQNLEPINITHEDMFELLEWTDEMSVSEFGLLLPLILTAAWDPAAVEIIGSNLSKLQNQLFSKETRDSLTEILKGSLSKDTVKDLQMVTEGLVKLYIESDTYGDILLPLAHIRRILWDVSNAT